MNTSKQAADALAQAVREMTDVWTGSLDYGKYYMATVEALAAYEAAVAADAAKPRHCDECDWTFTCWEGRDACRKNPKRELKDIPPVDSFRGILADDKAESAQPEKRKVWCQCGDEMYTCGKPGCKEMPDDSGPPAAKPVAADWVENMVRAILEEGLDLDTVEPEEVDELVKRCVPLYAKYAPAPQPVAQAEAETAFLKGLMRRCQQGDSLDSICYEISERLINKNLAAPADSRDSAITAQELIAWMANKFGEDTLLKAKASYLAIKAERAAMSAEANEKTL